MITIPNLPAINHAQMNLFRAIRWGNQKEIHAALGNGASVNAIDTISKDTPLFYAIKIYLENIIYAYDHYSNLHLNTSDKLIVISLATSVCPFLWDTYTQKTSSSTFFIACLAIPTVFISNAIYLRYQRNLLSTRESIIINLLNNPRLNLDYRHEITGQSIRELIDSILNAPEYGYACSVMDGISYPVDTVHSVIINGTEYIFCNKIFELYIKPRFEKLQN